MTRRYKKPTSVERSGRHEFNPDWVVAPGESLREWMEEMHMPVRVLAVACGRMPVEMLEGIMAGEVEITEPIAKGLECGTGASAVFWLNMERIYRDGLAAGKKVL